MRQTDANEKRSGAVSFCVHGATGKVTSSNFTTPKLIQRLQAGLPFNELEYLQTAIDVPMEKLASMIGMSKATLHRRKNEGRLAPGESDRVIRFARLLGRAIEVMESEDKARQWLTSPQFGLGGEVPLEYAETELGAREVENVLGRIEYGVYS